jgi:DNA (cytosine-5)-methyltransferase 1
VLNNNDHPVASGITTPPLRVLSLFAGIGGIDLGLEAHGCETVAYSEVDPYACRVMAQHFPNAVNLGDITAIDWEDVAREHSIDIICGGFPCQDISTAGLGAGIADGTRSGLWANYADAIRILRPRGVLVENVAALLARGLDRVLGDLAACGYDAEWDCIPAAAVGAPHLRDRLFIVAYPGSVEHEGPSDAERGATTAGLPQADRVPDAERDELRIEPVAERGGSGSPQLADDGSSRDVADTAGKHGRTGRTGRAGRTPAHGEGRRTAWPTPRRRDWWAVEPDVGRVADGVPARMDRLRCLGNAVVPQVAEHVAGILIDRMEQVA